MKTLLLSSLVGLALAVFFPSSCLAQLPGAHPAYLHALDDLRDARAHLARRRGDLQMNWDEHVAIREIDAAIHEIKMASIDDGKNLADHPPIDATLDYRGRLHRALELLHKAHSDVKQEEDDTFAQGLQHRAIRHIDAATSLTEQGIAAAEAR
jgi:hypothetical protein